MSQDMLRNPEYWSAVARGIDAENSKAIQFIKDHNQSRGLAKEAILRDVLVKHTPEPFRVTSGFIYACPKGQPTWNSKQCDVLVYDPTQFNVGYSIGDLSVVFRWSAKLAAEVKSKLDKDTLQDMITLRESVCWLQLPTIGFAYSGWTFDTAVDKLRESISASTAGMPESICNHKENYIFVRSGYTGKELPNRDHRSADRMIAVDFGKDQRQGQATASLLVFYQNLLRFHVQSYEINRWIDEFQIPKDSIVNLLSTKTPPRP